MTNSPMLQRPCTKKRQSTIVPTAQRVAAAGCNIEDHRYIASTVNVGMSTMEALRGQLSEHVERLFASVQAKGIQCHVRHQPYIMLCGLEKVHVTC